MRGRWVIERARQVGDQARAQQAGDQACVVGGGSSVGKDGGTKWPGVHNEVLQPLATLCGTCSIAFHGILLLTTLGMCDVASGRAGRSVVIADPASA